MAPVPIGIQPPSNRSGGFFISEQNEANMGEVILRLPEVRARTGLGRSTIYDAIARGDFPPPIKLGLRAVSWAESEIAAWMESRKLQRKAA